MQKTIRLMAIFAAALIAFSLFLILVTIPFQGIIAQALYGFPRHTGALPQFPLLPFINCFLQAGCAVLLIFSCSGKKSGIGLEIIVLGCMVLILPGIIRIATPLYTRFMGMRGGNLLAASSMVSNIVSLCTIPSNWGQALAYVACGMSIAFKTISKKQNAQL